MVNEVTVPAIFVSKSDSDSDVSDQHDHEVIQGSSQQHLESLPVLNTTLDARSTPYRPLGTNTAYSPTLPGPRNVYGSPRGSLSQSSLSAYDTDTESDDLQLEISDCIDLALGDSDVQDGVWMPSNGLRRRKTQRDDDHSFTRPPDLEEGIPLQDLSRKSSHTTRHELKVPVITTTPTTAPPSPKSTKDAFKGIFKTISENINGDIDTDSSSTSDSSIDSDHDVYGLDVGQNAGDVLQSEDEAETRDQINTELEEDAEDQYDVFDTGQSSGSSLHSEEIPPQNPFSDKNEKSAPDGPLLYGKSLGLFSADNPFRKSCYKIVSASYFSQFMTTLIVIQTAMLAFQEWRASTQYMIVGHYTIIDWVLAGFYIIYSCEMVLKCIAYGVWGHAISDFYTQIVDRMKGKHPKLDETTPNKTPKHKPYLFTSWNRVDAVSVISFWISFGLSMSGYDIKHELPLFRSLMCLKIVRLFNITHGTRACLQGMRAAFSQCKEVTLFLLCFWIFFAIIGVQSFKTSLRRHCVWTNPKDASQTYTQDLQFCGSYLEPNTLEPMPWIYAGGATSSQIKGYRCPVYSKCVLENNPYDGTVSFDNMVHSLEMIFVIMSANTFTDIMYYTIDSESLTASIFYVVTVFFLVVWLLNLVVAVIINSYRAHLELMERKDEIKKSSLEAKINENHIKYNAFVAHSRIVRAVTRTRGIFVVIILFNFIFQCTKSGDNPSISFDKFYYSEVITSLILLVEIILRIIAFLPGKHLKMFFYSMRNCIDLTLVFVTVCVNIPSVYTRLASTWEWLTVFSICRFYRVVIEFKWIRDAWASVLFRTKPFLHVCLLFVLSIILLGIIYSRLFEGVIPVETYLDEDKLILQNLPNVMLSLYVITSTENWTAILYLAQQCATNDFTRICAAVYLITWFVFSNVVILNIFIAIITDNIGVPENEKKNRQISQFYHKLKKSAEVAKDTDLLFSLRQRIQRSSTEEQHTAKQLIEKLKVVVRDLPGEKEHEERTTWQKFKHTWKKFLQGLPFYDDTVALYNLVHKRHEEATDSLISNSSGSSDSSDDAVPLPSAKATTTDRSLGIFPPNNRFRRACQRIVAPSTGIRPDGVKPIPRLRDIFSIIMFVASVVIIILSCYTTPLYKRAHGYYINTFNWVLFSDIGFALMFTSEFVIKIVADDFLFGECAYCRSFWNLIDFAVLFSIWFTVFSQLLNHYNASTIIGAIRAMRGFRLLTITKTSKDSFQFAVVTGAKRIFAAAIIAFSLLIPFALWGLNLFRGKLGECVDGVSTLEECTMEYTQTPFNWEVVSPKSYSEPPLMFNNIRKSIFSLFQIVSLEGWVDLLLNLTDITKIGYPRSTFASPQNAIFIVLFNFFSITLILNVFISLVINNYSMQTGVAYLSEQQLGWYEVKKALKQVKPSRRTDPSNMSPQRLKLYNAMIGKNKFFSRSVNLLLLLHLVGLISEAYPMNNRDNMIRYAIFTVSTSGLLIYNMLGMYAYGPKLFFANKWNIFRTFVITGAFAMNLASFFIPRTTSFTNFDKTFLVAVILFIIPRVDILNQLLRFASASLPSLLGIIYTWGVLYIVFAMALNEMFGLTRLGVNTSGALNARTVPKALVMLFRCSFGEGWNYIMNDFAVESQCSDNDHSYMSDCGNEGMSYFLFIAWNVLSMYIFLNILMSVVVNNFSYVYHGSGPHAAITRDELRKFKRAWAKFDPCGSGYIKTDDFQNFLSSLDGVLSYHVYPEKQRVPELATQWVRYRSMDPYDLDLDFDSLESSLNRIDFKKARDRRTRYDRLYIEAMLNKIEKEDGPVLAFTDVLQMIGFYSRFKDSTCLTLEDFIKRSILMKRVNKILNNMKLQATVEMTITRMRFKSGALGSTETRPTDFDPWTAPEVGQNHNDDDAFSTTNPFQTSSFQTNPFV